MRRPGCRAGAVYVEFLIVVGPLVLFMLGIVQLGLLYSAHLLVSHAASRAARAAIVILPDEAPGGYAGVAPYRVGGGGDGLAAYESAPANGRLEQIRRAARLVVAPLAPTAESLDAKSVEQTLAGRGASSWMLGLMTWTRKAVAVTFPDGAGGYRASFSGSEPVTARVTYIHKCSVPIARHVLCRRYHRLPWRALREMSTVGVGIALGGALALSGWRFSAITTERTLPIQGAP